MEENIVSKDNLVTLTDEQNNEHDFVVIDVFEIDERRYAILLPVFEGEGDEGEVEVDFEEDAYIFRVEMDEQSGEEVILEVDDEKEWKRVALAWERQIESPDGEEPEGYI